MNDMTSEMCDMNKGVQDGGLNAVVYCGSPPAKVMAQYPTTGSPEYICNSNVVSKSNVKPPKVSDKLLYFLDLILHCDIFTFKILCKLLESRYYMDSRFGLVFCMLVATHGQYDCRTLIFLHRMCNFIYLVNIYLFTCIFVPDT